MQNATRSAIDPRKEAGKEGRKEEEGERVYREVGRRRKGGGVVEGEREGALTLDRRLGGGEEGRRSPKMTDREIEGGSGITLCLEGLDASCASLSDD